MRQVESCKMDKTVDSFEDSPPSYTESSTPNLSHGAALGIRLAAVQSERINRLLEACVKPLLESQVASGIARTTFVLIPSDSRGLEEANFAREWPPDKKVDRQNPGAHEQLDTVEGFPAEEDVKTIRLHGKDNTARFWEQPGVIRDLEVQLHRQLGLPPEPTESKPSYNMPALEPRSEQKRPFWKAKKAQQRTKDYRTEISKAPSTSEPYMTLSVTVEDICVRYMTPVGLYDTRNGSAIVLRVRFSSFGGPVMK